MPATPEELEKIKVFVWNSKISDSILEMEETLNLCIGYGARIGELANESERIYSLKFAEALNKLRDCDDETETTRKAKLQAWTAEDREAWLNLKNLKTHLRARQMSLMQAIKTRREEPH